MSTSVRLKEADAFQRLVCEMPKKRIGTTITPQRSRRLSASGIVSEYDAKLPERIASKKQTPFSVWYASARTSSATRGRASKKQTPFSVWYSICRPVPAPSSSGPQRSRRLSASGIGRDRKSPTRARARLKEADAFQRLVYHRSEGQLQPPHRRLKEADAFQRLV